MFDNKDSKSITDSPHSNLAGRDINLDTTNYVFNGMKFEDVLRVSDSDLCDVINSFPEIEEYEDDEKFSRINLVDKNKINKLTDDYFRYNILQDSLPYFTTIDSFLEDPRNVKLRMKFLNTAADIKGRIMSAGGMYPTFDLFLETYCNDIFSSLQDKLEGKRRLIRIFLHYMYFTCKIGKKNVDPNP